MDKGRRAAQWTLRGLGAVAILMAAATLAIALLGGSPLEWVFAAVNGGIYALIGVGLWRANEKVWVLLLLLLGPLAAFQGAMLFASRDFVIALPFALNVATIATLIWAGRQLGAPLQAPSQEVGA